MSNDGQERDEASSSERQLIHQVNNLLGVIFTQAAVARSGDGSGSEGRASQALEVIERAAESTADVVRQLRARPPA